MGSRARTWPERTRPPNPGERRARPPGGSGTGGARSYTRPRGRGNRGPRPEARVVDGHLRARYRPLPHPRPRPRGRRRLLLRRAGEDQRVHGRVPGTEPDSRARRHAALSSAFVPIFSELLEKGERKRAWRVASSLFWLMLLGLSALTALFVLVAPWVIGLFGNPGHDRALAVGLSRLLFPIVTLLGVSGIVVGILNSYDHFTVPALSPVFWNLAIIIGLAIGVPQAQTMSTKLYVYAVSILVATLVQVFLPMPWLR